jgi:hypothetical protein
MNSLLLTDLSADSKQQQHWTTAAKIQLSWNIWVSNYNKIKLESEFTLLGDNISFLLF